jgi:hypothetical protein
MGGGCYACSFSQAERPRALPRHAAASAARIAVFAATTLKLWHGATAEIRLPNQALVNPYHGGAETLRRSSSATPTASISKAIAL